MFFWHVPAPNEALLISGSKRRQEDTQCRIVTGHGCFVLPIKQKARILSLAQAHADQEATARELEVAAMKAQYERDTETKRAGFLAETEEARAKAAQAGPLAEAQASQQVIEQQTALAERLASLAAQRLEADVRRPADTEAYRQRTLAEAERDKTRFETEAEAYRKRSLAEADRDQAKLAAEAEAFRSTTLAEAEAQAARVRAEAAAQAQRATAEGDADANRARAASLREGNQELIAASRLIEQLPALVEASARSIAGSNLTILNGAQGVSEMLAGLVGQGLAILEVLRKPTAVAADGTLPSAAGPERAERHGAVWTDERRAKRESGKGRRRLQAPRRRAGARKGHPAAG